MSPVMEVQPLDLFLPACLSCFPRRVSTCLGAGCSLPLFFVKNSFLCGIGRGSTPLYSGCRRGLLSSNFFLFPRFVGKSDIAISFPRTPLSLGISA